MKRAGACIPPAQQPSLAPTCLRRAFPPPQPWPWLFCAAAHAQCRLSCGAGRAARAQHAGQSPRASSPRPPDEAKRRRTPRKGEAAQGPQPQGASPTTRGCRGLNAETRAAVHRGYETMRYGESLVGFARMLAWLGRWRREETRAGGSRPRSRGW